MTRPIVRTLSIHGTELSLAIDRTLLEAGGGLTAEDFAAYVEAAFQACWHVFGGYPFDRYAVRIRAEDGNDGFSLSPVGITLGGSDYAALPLDGDFDLFE